MQQQGNQKGRCLKLVLLIICPVQEHYVCGFILIHNYLSRAAYVEFMRKEAAENALSLDGTSYLSRILKVLITAWY